MDSLGTKTEAATKHLQQSGFLPEPNISPIPKEEEFVIEEDQPTKTDLEKTMIKLAQAQIKIILRDLFKSKNLPTYQREVIEYFISVETFMIVHSVKNYYQILLCGIDQNRQDIIQKFYKWKQGKLTLPHWNDAKEELARLCTSSINFNYEFVNSKPGRWIKNYNNKMLFYYSSIVQSHSDDQYYIKTYVKNAMEKPTKPYGNPNDNPNPKSQKKEIPPNYICRICSRKYTVPHFIHDCPYKRSNGRLGQYNDSYSVCKDYKKSIKVEEVALKESEVDIQQITLKEQMESINNSDDFFGVQSKEQNDISKELLMLSKLSNQTAMSVITNPSKH
eukprot:gene12813-7165_t